MMVKTLTPFHYRVTSKLEKLSKHSACSIFFALEYSWLCQGCYLSLFYNSCFCRSVEKVEAFF